MGAVFGRIPFAEADYEWFVTNDDRFCIKLFPLLPTFWQAWFAHGFVADVWLGFKIFIKIRILNLLLGGPWVAPGWPAWGWKYSPRP